MSDVQLTIGGRSYMVACQDGQEAHIRQLGEVIEAKLSSLHQNVRQNEPRTLLFAALLLADELHELRNRAPLVPAPAPVPAPPEDMFTAPALEALANKLENLAASLEGGVAPH